MQPEANMVRQAVISSIKKELVKVKWWKEVQDDVKDRLDWIVDHVDELGPLFALTFMTLFRWEFERRKTEGEKVTSPVAPYVSTVLGMTISEEAFQCGKVPARAVLALYDYVEPVDSDVAACLLLCHKIEILQTTGVLQGSEDELKTSVGEMAKLLRSPVPKKSRPKTKPQPQEEDLHWEEN